MPLASSLTSAQKRAEVVAMERRQQERRTAVVSGRRRLSLPSTIQSSTVATKSKVDRRRSIRRESSSGSVGSVPLAGVADKENALGGYSPPETRSAKKKKALNPAFLGNSTTAWMQFSPPDQEANQRNERERILRMEEQRYVSAIVTPVRA